MSIHLLHLPFKVLRLRYLRAHGEVRDLKRRRNYAKGVASDSPYESDRQLAEKIEGQLTAATENAKRLRDALEAKGLKRFHMPQEKRNNDHEQANRSTTPIENPTALQH